MHVLIDFCSLSWRIYNHRPAARIMESCNWNSLWINTPVKWLTTQVLESEYCGQIWILILFKHEVFKNNVASLIFMCWKGIIIVPTSKSWNIEYTRSNVKLSWLPAGTFVDVGPSPWPFFLLVFSRPCSFLDWGFWSLNTHSEGVSILILHTLYLCPIYFSSEL